MFSCHLFAFPLTFSFHYSIWQRCFTLTPDWCRCIYKPTHGHTILPSFKLKFPKESNFVDSDDSLTHNNNPLQEHFTPNCCAWNQNKLFLRVKPVKHCGRSRLRKRYEDRDEALKRKSEHERTNFIVMSIAEMNWFYGSV